VCIFNFSQDCDWSSWPNSANRASPTHTYQLEVKHVGEIRFGLACSRSSPRVCFRGQAKPLDTGKLLLSRFQARKFPIKISLFTFLPASQQFPSVFVIFESSSKCVFINKPFTNSLQSSSCLETLLTRLSHSRRSLDTICEEISFLRKVYFFSVQGMFRHF